jgi:hypothetical protein
MIKVIKGDETWSKLESLYKLGKKNDDNKNAQITFRNQSSQEFLDELEERELNPFQSLNEPLYQPTSLEQTTSTNF